MGWILSVRGAGIKMTERAVMVLGGAMTKFASDRVDCAVRDLVVEAVLVVLMVPVVPAVLEVVVLRSCSWLAVNR